MNRDLLEFMLFCYKDYVLWLFLMSGVHSFFSRKGQHPLSDTLYSENLSDRFTFYNTLAESVLRLTIYQAIEYCQCIIKCLQEVST